MGGEAAVADVLTLLDFYWFHHQILSKHRPPPPPTPPLHLDFEDTKFQTSEPDPTSRLRSPRDELAPSPEDLPIHPPKLQTILSGKQAFVGDEIARAEGSSGSDGEMRGAWGLNARRRRQSRRRSGGSSTRSLSDLEFEELKGFMDLGFTFSDAEADPRLMSIVPGLQRLRASAGDGASATEADAEASPSASDEPSVSRPYLSEAWDVAAAATEEEENNLLRSWRLPAAEDGVDMKHHLRLWAHTVASTVR